MNEKKNISYSAFLRQIEGWEITLRRQLARLNELNSENNRKMQNQIQLMQTEIECELLRYKKQKEKKNTYIDFDQIINKYNTFLKSFVQLIESINQIHQNNYTTSNIAEEQSAIMKKSNKSSARQNQSSSSLKKQSSKIPQKRYMDDTFTMKVTRDSRVNKSAQIKQRKKNMLVDKAAWLEQLMNQQKNKQKITQKIDQSYYSRQKVIIDRNKDQIKEKLVNKNLRMLESTVEQGENVNSMKKQLLQIKGAILEIYKKIDSHGHEQYEHQLTKLKNNNKKIMMDIKVIKEENTSFLHQMHQTRKQLQQEKKLQLAIIKQVKKMRTGQDQNQSNQKQSYPEEYCIFQSSISDWVKQRLQRM